MEIDPVMFQFMQEVKGTLGSIDSKITAQNNHLQAVSQNVKDIRKEVAEHKEDLDAHGGKSTSRWIGHIGGLSGVAAALYEILKAK